MMLLAGGKTLYAADKMLRRESNSEYADLANEIDQHLRQLAPHQKERATARWMERARDALRKIDQLEAGLTQEPFCYKYRYSFMGCACIFDTVRYDKGECLEVIPLFTRPTKPTTEVRNHEH